MIFIELTQDDHGVCIWLNPNAIDEMVPGSYGSTLLTMKGTGKVWKVREKPSDILDKIRKAREDEKREVEAEGT